MRHLLVRFGAALLIVTACACSNDSFEPGPKDLGDTGSDVAEDTSGDTDSGTPGDATGGGDSGDSGDATDGGDDSGDTGDAGDTGSPSAVYEYDESEYDDYVDTSLHYRFPLDDEGWATIEPGSQHQKIYVSNDGDDANDGLSPETPVASLEKARGLLRAGSSDWVLLRRGDTFSQTRFREELSGESPEHPVLIGAYGDGARPVIDGAFMLWATHRNVVIRDLKFTKVGKYCLDVLGTIENLYVENVVTQGCESRIQGSEDPRHVGVTLRRSMLLDGHLPEPVNDENNWRATLDNRLSGIYVANVNGLFIEETYADFNGWEPGYDEEAGPGPQPPSMYSHNFYLQWSNRNIVFRGNIVSRGASFGAQVRPGGVVQRNVFIANNAAFFTGGDNASLVEENVVTIAGNKEAFQIGARGWGLHTSDVAGTVLRRNVVVHSVDPLGSIPEDFANSAIANTDGATLEDNVVWNWGSSDNSPASLPAGVEPESISLLEYASSSPINSAEFDAFDQRLRQRDRDDWPVFLSAPTIVDYFSAFRGE